MSTKMYGVENTFIAENTKGYPAVLCAGALLSMVQENKVWIASVIENKCDETGFEAKYQEKFRISQKDFDNHRIKLMGGKPHGYFNPVEET